MRYLFVLLVFLSVNSAAENNGMTESQFKKKIRNGEESIDHSGRLLKASELHTLLGAEVPVKNDAVNPKGGGVEVGDPSSNEGKMDRGEDAEAASQKLASDKADATKKKIKKKIAKTKKKTVYEPVKQVKVSSVVTDSKALRSDKTYYLDPSLSGGEVIKNKSKTVNPGKGKRIIFGVTIGSEIKVRLNKGASNAQLGLVAFEVLEDVYGYKVSLPSKTLLFGSTSAVIGTPRLYVSIRKGITPDHLEFTIDGFALASDGLSGLSGIVTSDGRTLVRASDAGKNALASSVVDSVSSSNMLVGAAQDAAGEMLSEEKSDDRAENGRPAYVVEASPQEAIIQVERTF
ncbi:MAG: hypothetical protein HRU20_21610 [Pseudomonadales bacterium]|nr:hypothetical protein [Pseudomonadales bacterium]